MIRTNDPVLALDFCAVATRLGLGLEVTAEGGGVYALATRDWDTGAALWSLLAGGLAARLIDPLWLQSERDAQTTRAAALSG